MKLLVFKPTIFSLALLGCSLSTHAQTDTLDTETVRQPKGMTQTQSGTNEAALDAAAELKARRCAALEQEMNARWHPGFDWSMPKRYGNDRALYDDGKGGLKGNGIIDLPNTSAYVSNNKSYSNDPADACTCKPQPDGTCAPRFRVDLTLDGTRQATWRRVPSSVQSQRERFSCPMIDITDAPDPAAMTWVVDERRFAAPDEGDTKVCLTEGHHPITLEMRYGEEMRSVTRYIEVIDHLIVNLGDSFGAGEGVPETNYRPELMQPLNGDTYYAFDWSNSSESQIPFFAQWADPGIEIPMTRRSIKAYSDIFATKETYDGKEYPVPLTYEGDATHRAWVTMPDWEEIKRQFYKAGQPDNHPFKILMDHQHSHRSSATGASQLALHLEYWDPKSSVTFINLAASGAQMQIGMLNPYRGVFELKDRGNMGDFLPKHGNLPGLQPQIDHLADLIGERNIDHIYLSVGGNDAGFANVIEVFLQAWSFDDNKLDQNIIDMRNFLKDGHWHEADFGGLLGAGWDGANKDEVTGLTELNTDYRAVNDRFIAEVGTRRLAESITLIGYPNFTTSSKNRFDPAIDVELDDGRTAYYCDIKVRSGEDPMLHRHISERIPGGHEPAAPIIDVDLDFDPEEFKQASRIVLDELTSKMRSSVNELNTENRVKGVDTRWSFLEQGDEPKMHGICGGDYYNRFKFNENYNNYVSTNLEYGSFLTNSIADADGYAWYRTPQAAGAIQRGTPVINSGLFHPNEFGYRHVGRRMMEELEFYGAELTEDAFIDPASSRYTRFFDNDDSILEAGHKGIKIPGSDFEGRLAGSQDVAMFAVTMTGIRCTPTTFRLDVSDAGRDLVLTVFAANGEVLGSTSDFLRPEIKSTGAVTFANITQKSEQDVSVSTSSGRDKFSTQTPSQTLVPVHQNKFCKPEAYVALDGKLREVNAASEVVLMSQHLNVVYVAVSHADNLKFDPVTGRGDNRSNMTRGSVSFRIEVETE